MEAQRGGSGGYRRCGQELVRHARSLLDFNIPKTEADELLAELDGLLATKGNLHGEREAAIFEWFLEVFPACMQLIPNRRAESFVTGVVEAWHEGLLRTPTRRGAPACGRRSRRCHPPASSCSCERRSRR